NEAPRHDAETVRSSTRLSSISATRRIRADKRWTVPSEKRLTPGTAPAQDEPFAIGVVMVRNLLAPPDRSRRANPNHPVRDMDVAVRPAGMIDVSGDIAADARVDDRAVRQLEAPDVAAADVAPLPLQAFLIGNLFTR